MYPYSKLYADMYYISFILFLMRTPNLVYNMVHEICTKDVVHGVLLELLFTL